ncbi:hypothetical protein ALC62_13295 [Cyphomyrmex costatus]|uniref:Uncharacterized protein n=1 Tax=Cyphomyrmex costatus TaxID=456900 RepID=A0A151IA38_9HYME|nr:hypothetical protein ALC62_13295 [Cyphomyrmex costatus]
MKTHYKHGENFTEKFPGRIISCNRDFISRQDRAMTPLDFLLRNYMKDKIFTQDHLTDIVFHVLSIAQLYNTLD